MNMTKRDIAFNNSAKAYSLFQQYYGILTPSRHDSNTSKVAELGRWAHRNRRYARHNQLQDHRIQLLKDINFEFDAQTTSSTMPYTIKAVWDELIDLIVRTSTYPKEDENLYQILVQVASSNLLIDEHYQKLKGIDFKNISQFLKAS